MPGQQRPQPPDLWLTKRLAVGYWWHQGLRKGHEAERRESQEMWLWPRGDSPHLGLAKGRRGRLFTAEEMRGEKGEGWGRAGTFGQNAPPSKRGRPQRCGEMWWPFVCFSLLTAGRKLKRICHFLPPSAAGGSRGRAVA